MPEPAPVEGGPREPPQCMTPNGVFCAAPIRADTKVPLWCNITAESSHWALVLVFLALRSARAPSLCGARVPPSFVGVSC